METPYTDASYTSRRSSASGASFSNGISTPRRPAQIPETQPELPSLHNNALPELSPHDKLRSSTASSSRWAMAHKGAHKILTRRMLLSILLTTTVYFFFAFDTTPFYPHVITGSSNSVPASVLIGEQLQKLEQTQLDSVDPEVIAEHLQQLLAPSTHVATSDSDADLFVDYAQTYSEDDLRTRLIKKFPYFRASSIPKIVWQIWKESLPEVKNNEIRKYMSSWAEQSKDGYDYRVVTDSDIEDVVSTLYGDFPEILEAYKLLPLDILRFDFLRYLLLYALGGVYSDVDTLAMKDLQAWADTPRELTDYITELPTKEVGLVIGVEGDYDRPDWRFKTSRRLQFCQWTFKSKPGHPVLRELIHKITQTTLRNYNQRLNHVKIGKEYFTLHSVYTVLEWTGPAAFTDVIFAHFNKLFNTANWFGINTDLPEGIKHTGFEDYHKEKNSVSESKSIGWTNFTKLAQPAMYDDVLILPVSSFNGFIDDSDEKIDDDLVYVKHEFHGSWKDL